MESFTKSVDVHCRGGSVYWHGAHWEACCGECVFAFHIMHSSDTACQRLTKLELLVLLQAWYAREQYSARDWIRPGKILHHEGLRPKHPIVIVPGMSVQPELT